MLSFKINKKSGSATNPVQTSSKQLPKKAFNDEEDGDEEGPDFIDGLDGNKIVSKNQSKKKVEKKQLVIPLITKNEWRIDKKADRRDKHHDPSVVRDDKSSEVTPNNENDSAPAQEQEVKTEREGGDTLKQQAIKELLQGSSSELSDKKSNRSIPILFQNRVPEGYEEDDNMDVSLRPDQSTLDDYDQIPIEEFGLAMLRGMGWKETEGIGLKNKKVVDMAEPKLRPKGMGLGAEPARMMNKDVAPKHASQNGEEKEDLSVKIGGYAVIIRGSKKGHYGQIESFDEDNNRVILRLAINGKMEAVSKFYINIVSSKEYKKSSKVINSEKYEEYKIKQESKSQQNYDSDEYDNSRQQRYKRSSSNSDEDERSYRSKPRRRDRDEDSTQNNDHRSSHRDRNRDRERSRERDDGRHYRDKHTSRKHDDKRYSESSRRDEYDRKRASDKDKRSDHRRRKDDDRDRERR